jgi:hypothetical protein
MNCRAFVLRTFCVTGLAACDWIGDASGLTAELENRYPESRITIEDLREDGARRVAVRIEAASFDENLDVALESRAVAHATRQRYELVGRSDTVEVEFRSERRIGPFASSHEARFLYPVSELND